MTATNSLGHTEAFRVQIVPEPQTYALIIVLALAGVSYWRRRG